MKRSRRVPVGISLIVHSLPRPKNGSHKKSVTVIQGLQDSMVPSANAYYAERQQTHSKSVKLVTIPDANHFIPWTRFNMIKSVLMQFAVD